MIGKRDARCLAWLGFLLVVQFAPVLFTGRTYFLRDLTYINHPWRAFSMEELTAGRLPLWDPFAYLGLPHAANMQSQVFYPFGVGFYLFDFSTALKVFHLLHYGLAGFLCYLWLRSWRFGRAGATAAASVLMLGGPLLARLEFLNLIAVIALAPALALFARRPTLLALALALGFLAGHPQALAAVAALAFFASPGLAWLPASLMAAAASSVLLLPAARMVLDSARAGGLDTSVMLSRSLRFSDLPGLIAPWAAPADAPDAYSWWRALYIGLSGSAVTVFGFFRANRRIAFSCAGLALLALFVSLGGSTAASAWVWTNIPLFHFIRYPGNFDFLILLPLLPLIAAGITPRRRLLVLLVGIELLAYGWNIQPTEPSWYWYDKGPNVTSLQASLDGHRYFLSPRATAEQRGLGRTPEQAYLDLKHRLQGLTHLPFRIAAAGGDGEPLVPASHEKLLDEARSAASLEAALPLLAKLDVTRLLVPGPDPRDPRWKEVPVPPAPVVPPLEDRRDGFLPGLGLTSASLIAACIYLYNRARRSVRAF